MEIKIVGESSIARAGRSPQHAENPGGDGARRNLQFTGDASGDVDGRDLEFTGVEEEGGLRESRGKLGRMVWLLEDYYDHQHRAYLMAEKHMRLRPLKIRSHGASLNDMAYDERYTEYIKGLGLLPFITLVSRSTPNLNAAAITALVDRWRLETHTFHLRTEGITPTLHDVSMIFGLPIAGEPLCISTDSDGWHNAMELLIGMAPEELEDKSKDRVPAGATYAWIVSNFRQCPNPAEVEVIETHARVYMWYVLSRTLFADSGGRTA
uniref:Uncharacterized protein n=1 Tax=Avena sativa TaxID=4498 RepID=A0ACD5V3Y8_AVESA